MTMHHHLHVFTKAQEMLHAFYDFIIGIIEKLENNVISVIVSIIMYNSVLPTLIKVIFSIICYNISLVYCYKTFDLLFVFQRCYTSL